MKKKLNIYLQMNLKENSQFEINLKQSDSIDSEENLVCYVLRLENGKYYVGKTSNIEYRMMQHYSGDGSKWTKLHYSIEIMEIIPFAHKWQESYTTLVKMKEYGVDNVRGGPWCMVDLQFKPKIHLLDEKKSIHENYLIYCDATKSSSSKFFNRKNKDNKDIVFDFKKLTLIDSKTYVKNEKGIVVKDKNG